MQTFRDRRDDKCDDVRDAHASSAAYEARHGLASRARRLRRTLVVGSRWRCFQFRTKLTRPRPRAAASRRGERRAVGAPPVRIELRLGRLGAGDEGIELAPVHLEEHVAARAVLPLDLEMYLRAAPVAPRRARTFPRRAAR